MSEGKESALFVQPGVAQPEAINSKFAASYKRKRKLAPEEYEEGILAGNRVILSQAITLIESTHPDHTDIAQKIIGLCLPYSGKSMRIGITGVPGVGKSSFIETLGKFMVGQKRKLCVLAIDPTSQLSKGSILGDKTRMEEISKDENVFIRPSPAGNSLGGVARKTRETIVLCEAAGFDTIFVETVGVGQSEIAVHSMVDFFLLLMLAGAGDELQGIKRGIMEMADLIAITKADGTNINSANLAKSDYIAALHLFPPTESGWIPGVEICSAVTGDGIQEIWNLILSYSELVKNNRYFEKKRLEQSKYWMHQTIEESLKSNFYNNPQIKSKIPEMEKSVFLGKHTSFQAAYELLALYNYQSTNKLGS
ncbi:MAG: methylmalonyl Co-A mutase-associated GTPase MeaB [Leptospiraceae bacterium]|nr:methylmalonyl Co-A mutase-associated GTPase MeaB [Leptospiraceae bacterium]MCP5496682.1 methylmalonyl Co-A mutase-associated GTPase MeaB [Leptospiraceae bacterium]